MISQPASELLGFPTAGLDPDKGDKLGVEGYLMYDSYERDGVTIPTAEIRARELVMLAPRAAV